MCGVIPPWLKVGAAISPFLKLDAALHAERTGDCCQDGDDEIDDGFPIFLFHFLLLILMLILIYAPTNYTDKHRFCWVYGDNHVTKDVLRLSVKICVICGKIKEGLDEQVPVHDGVSLSFADISLGGHRNTPDCILPYPLSLLEACFASSTSSGIGSRIGSGIGSAWSGASGRTILGWGLGAAALHKLHSLDGGIKIG